METEALEIRIGVRPTSDLPRVAANALAAGKSTSALRELAGLIGTTANERSEAIETIGEVGLRDLGVLELDPADAAEQLVRRYAQDIVSGDRQPLEGCADIVRAITAMGWEGMGEPLWDEGTGDMWQFADMYFGRTGPEPSKERVEWIEDGITKAAGRLTRA